MFPLTTETGTQRWSQGKSTCWEVVVREASRGSFTIRSFASRAGLGPSQEKFAWEGWGLESLFMRAKESSWRRRGREKAEAMDW